MKEIKEQKGITLVALIITIVILLILALVIINNITNDGILGKTQGGIEEHKKAELKEKIVLELNEKRLNNMNGMSEDDVYLTIITYDKDNKIKDQLGSPYIETEDGIKVLVSELYNFNEKYFINKEYPGAIVISNGTEIDTFQKAIDKIGDSTESEVYIYMMDSIEWEAGQLIPTNNTAIQKLIITGKTGSRLTFTGSDYQNVSVGSDAAVTFKGITIKDSTGSTSTTAWELAYLEFSGTIKFEECIFENGVMMSNNNTNVEIIGCTFNYGNEPSIYNLWLKCKTAIVKDCKFYGKRYIKVHNQYDIDIEDITIENSEFNLFESAKPCLAMGTIDSDTKITMKNNNIYYYENSSKGDLDNYVYESDTDITTFTFINENNLLFEGK